MVSFGLDGYSRSGRRRDAQRLDDLDRFVGLLGQAVHAVLMVFSSRSMVISPMKIPVFAALRLALSFLFALTTVTRSVIEGGVVAFTNF